MLSFCDTPLVLPDAETLAWIGEHVPPDWLTEFAGRSWPGYKLEHVPFRGALRQGPSRIGVLSWPAGASNFACGHFLTDEVGLARIRETLASPGEVSLGGGLFVLDDGRKKVETRLHCLPARPLARVARGVPGLYLLTLVDARFYWWYKGGEMEVIPRATTWEDLYTQVGELLGVEIHADAVHEAYLKPPDGLEVHYRALPVLLDAIAVSCGQRIVRDINGRVYALSAESSYLIHQSNLGVAATNPPYERLAGHELDLSRESGAFNKDDLDRLAPRRVSVAFRTRRGCEPVSEHLAGAYHLVTTALVSLELSQYGSAVGFPGTRFFHSTAWANLPDAGDTASNAAELTALGERIAEDYYLWLLGSADALYEGACAWLMEAHAEVVEWEHTLDRICTRVGRGAYHDHVEDLLHEGAGCATGSGSRSGSGPPDLVGWAYCQKVVIDVRCTEDGWEYDAEFMYFDEDGHFLFTSDEPCDPDDDDDDTGCSGCLDDDPGDTLMLTVGTIGNDECEDCSEAGGYFAMNRTSPCEWTSDTFTLCGVGSAFWRMNRDANLWNVWLFLFGGDTVIFHYSASADSCAMPLSLPRISSAGQCTGPDTIGVEGEGGDGDDTDCSDCGASDPGDTLTLEVSGYANGECDNCTNANGTFTLTRDSLQTCRWESNGFTVCGQSGTIWYATRFEGVWDVFLAMPGGDLAHYSATTTLCTLDTPLVLNLLTDDNVSCTAPATVTLSAP